jgi:sugar-specific transcriptional regulator TrmB
MSTCSNFQRLLKSIHQGGRSESIVEPIRNGIHVEFKFSSQNEQIKQKRMKKKIYLSNLIISLSSIVALFDVPKPNDEDMIIFTQNKCKRLLAETKQKMFDLFFIIKD